MILLFGACQTEEIDTTTNTPVFVPVEGQFVNATVRGAVVDLNGDGVEAAFVDYKGNNTITDAEGNFVLSGQLDAAGTYLRVTKSGYFDGSRKFSATEEATDFVNVQLVQRDLSGVISSTEGGEVAIDGSIVDLPAGTYRTENNQAYEGEVEVYAHYMDPTEPATFDQMPGDLTGFTTEGEIQGLITYGMMNIELQDASGNTLQLPEGQTAVLTMPVPDELMETAPSTIPLWHFDEERAIWIEEGEAQLVNGQYIGDVSHFTLWNCDIPFDFVCIEGSVEFNNSLAANFTLRFTSSSSGLSGIVSTNSRGSFNIKVPKDEPITLTVSGGCGQVAQNIPLGSFSNDQNVGTISVSNTVEDFTLVGSVEVCGGGPVTNGVAQVIIDDVLQTIPLESDGSFDFTFSNCSGSDVYVAGVDWDNNMISEYVEITATGFQDVGVLEACDLNPAGDIIISYPGQNWALSTQDSTIVATYSDIVITNQGGPDKIIREIVVLDWLTGSVAEGTFTFNEGETEAMYTMQLPQGFEITGTTEMQSDPFVLVTDTSSDITVTDPSIYPGNVDEVFFYIRID